MKNFYTKYIMKNSTSLFSFTKKDQVENEKDQVKVSMSQSLMEKFKGLVGERISGLEVMGGSRTVVDTYFPCVLSRIVSKRSRDARVNGSFLRYAAAVALILCLGVVRSFAAVDYCQSSAFGYGASAIGGGSATPVLVSTVDQLKSALNKASNKVIIITSNLTFTSMLSVQDGSNITLMGLPGVTLTSLQQDASTSGILFFKRYSNVIIRNLTFVGPGAYDCDGNDLLCFENVTTAWVDHCDFQDGCDGNFDNKHNTDNVTVSWCRFRYLKAPRAGGSGGSDDHRFTNLLGSSSSDKPTDGTFNFTWAYCWWDNGCKERMVRCRNAELHFINCYWNSSVANYYVGPENAKCYFKGCTFAGNANSASKIFKSYGGTNACYFDGCTGNTPSNSGSVSAPVYAYSAFDNASAAVTAVTNSTCGAGATLTVTRAGAVSSTCDGGVSPTIYTVTWNATTNGGSCGTSSTLVESGQAIGTLPTATKSGYTFGGWFTASSGGTQINASTTVSGNITYYAQFTEISGGGGGGCPSSGTLYSASVKSSVSSDQSFAASSLTEVSSSTQADISGGKLYANNGQGSSKKLIDDTNSKYRFCMTNDNTFFKIVLDCALQEGDVITIDAVGGTRTKNEVTYELGLWVSTAVSKPGSVPACYGTSSSTSLVDNMINYTVTSIDEYVGETTIYIYRAYGATQYFDNINITRPGSTPTYTLSYDENGGSGSAMEDQEGTTLTVAANSFTAPTGYAFQKWNTAMNGGGTDYSAGGSITLTEDVTLYAIWQPQTYTVTLNQGSGSGGTASVTATFDAAMPSITVPTRSGYTFAGYFTEANGTGTQYYDENGSSTNDWTIANNTTLYANWTEGSAPAPTGCDLHFHFFYAADATSNSLTNDATVFTSMVSDGSAMAGSITIDGTSYSVTRRTGDNATFGTFTIPSGKTGTFYALAVSSGAGDRQINLVCGGTTYELPVAGGSDSYKRLEQDNLPAGTYSIQRDGSSNVRLGVVAVKLCDDVSCTAPNHVDVNGRWDRFGGETISLTATAYSSAGTGSPIAVGDITGYQWQKWYNSTWNDIAGATSATYTKSNCDKDDSGSYRCVVSTGATCSTASDGFQVKVYVLECYNGGTTVYNFTRVGDTQAGTVQIDLAAGTAYTFKVHADNDYYGNNGTVNEDVSNWVLCSSGDVACTTNLTVNSGLGGTFTFSMEYSTSGSSSVEGEPEISVTYPRKMIYLTPGVWNADGAKFAYYFYRTSGGSGWTDFLTSNDCGMYAEIPQWNGVVLIPCRLKNATVSPGSFDDRWNQTNDITVTSNDYVTITGWNASDFTYTTYSTPTYTISYAKGSPSASISGSKSDESKTCDVDFTLPSSAVFTREGYLQTGWTTSDCGSQTHAFGGSYTTNAAQTFYPVWTVQSFDLTWNLVGGTTTTAGTGIASGVSATTTSSVAYGTSLTAPTVSKTGYDFSGWSPSVESTMPATNTTYTATWTIKTTTITIDANTANHGSTTPGTVTATYGSALPSFTAAAGASGYSLTGYFTAATGGTKIINVDGTLVRNTTYATDESTPKWKYETSTLTLYAQYEKDAVLYTVTFNSNGGSAVSPVTQVSEGASISMPAAPTKADNTFQGWQIGGNTYAAGASYTPTENITAYALWKADCAGGGAKTVTFVSANKNDAGNAFAAMSNGDTQLVGEGLAKLIATNSVSLSTTANKYGYRCDGSRLYIVFRFTGTTDLTIQHNANSTGERYMRLYSFSSDKALSAITSSDWSTKTQKAFSSTSSSETWGSGQSSVVTIGTGDNLNKTWNYTTKGCLTVTWEALPAGYYVMDGTGSEAYIYSFTADDGAGGSTCYYVTYDGNGAESGYTNDPTAYAADASVTVLANGYTKAGYEFQGWANSTAHRDAGTVDYIPSGTFTITDDITLYAVWGAPCSTPDAPMAFANTAVTSTTATFLITDAADAASYDLYYASGSPSTPTDGTAATTNVTTKTPTIENLTASTTYKIWVRSVCDASHKSAWVALGGGGSFTTSTPTYTLTNVVNTAGYGTVSPASVTSIPSGATTSSSSNTYTVNGTTVTATPTSQTAQYSYSFDSWSGLPATVSANATVTANFTRTPRTYTITLNTNGGTINAGNVENYTYGTGATLPTNVTRTGYTFGGWYANSDLSTGGVVTTIANDATGNKEFWAKWTINNHTLTWNFDGGSSSETAGTHYTAGGSVNYGATITYPSDGSMSKVGYTFDGWSTDATTMPDENLTITAQWVFDACFMMAANSSAGSDATLSCGESISDGSKNCSTLSGGTAKYTFRTSSAKTMTVKKPNASGQQYGWLFGSNSDSIVITLAETKIQEGSLIIVSGYGSSGVGLKMNGVTTATNTTGTSGNWEGFYTVKSTDTALKGKNILNVIRASGSNTYIYSITITNCADRTSYDITNGDPSNGTIAITDGSSAISSAEEGETVHISATPDEGYSFTGWDVYKTDASATKVATAAVTASTTFTMPAYGVTVDATFTPNTYDITYHLNGASWASAAGAANYTYGVGATLPVAGDLSNVGYTFNGWYANSDLSTGGVKTEIGTSETGNKEYWAKWTEITYTITYDKNDGDATGSTLNTVGHYVTVAENGFSLAGKVFYGWNTASDGSGDSYAPGDEIELAANMTLYAQWGAVVTATWSVTKVDDKLYRGGGGYHVTVYLNQADWDVSGDKDDLELTATEGVTLKNVTKSINGSGKAQVEADFDITTDLAADATEISFTLSVPAAGSYASAELNHSEDLDDCSGGETIILTDFETSNHNKSNDNKPDSQTKYLYGYKGTVSASYALTLTSDNTNTKGQNSGVELRLDNAATLRIYANNTTNATPATFEAITSVAFDAKLYNSSGSERTTSYTIKVGSSTVGSGSITGQSTDGYKHISTGDFVAKDGYVDIILGSGNSNNNLYLDNITIVYGAGGSKVAPTLTWETDLSGGVTAETGDADFTHTASTTSNTLGAITYSSSNTSVATVNATTGKVHIVGAAGSATITATLAASGCYTEATTSYDITVTRDCDDVPGTISTNNLGCAGIELTVTGHTAEAGVTYQWYKDGASISGATSAAYTAIAEGEYYVVVTNTGNRHCDMMSTNTVVIESASDLSVENIITSWYVKNGRRTPDIALVQTTGAEGFAVKVGGSFIWKSDGSVTTGLGGCNFRLGDDGIIYLCGTKPNGDAPSDLTDATDVVLAVNVTACGGSNEDASNITIHCQGTTSRPSIAFVVDGTEKGAFDAENESHSVNTALYKFLDYGSDSQGAFDLTGRNIYSTVDETAIREHYSQFDAILITDDPNTGKKKDGKSYVDAFGTMIDVRPILTMEAFVSKLKNWSCVKGDPSSPSPRQYEMKLQCKDHEIYSGLPEPAAGTHVWSETIDGEEYRHVVMVDKTKSPYSSLANDNTDTDGTPAMQGFASEAIGNLLGLGLIKNDELQAGVERQEEPAARMMILGIQNKALPNALTDEGKKVIENALTYLLKTNMEEVDDCSNFFKGGDPTKPRDWNTVANWAKNTLPNYETKVRILAPCELSGATVKVAQVDIATSGKSSKKDTNGGVCNGSLTIAADGALIVNGKIRTTEAPHFTALDLKPTTPTDLTVEANSGGNGALVLNNEDGTTQATVAMYSKAWRNKEGNTTTWQYIGVPHSDVGNAKTNYYDSWLYRWDPSEGWLAVPSGGAVEPWTGYCITHPEAGHTYWMQGTLEATADQAIDVPDGAYQVIGNSWTAPIYIAAFEDDDFENINTKTIYFFNTGTDPEGDGDIDAGRWAAGTYVSVPIHSSPFTGDSLISSMQGFYVANTSGSAGTLHLDYDKLVRPHGSRNALAGQMHAPRRAAAISDRPVVAKLWVRGTRYDDRLVVLEREDFTEGYDAGWDGEKWDGSTIAPCVWSVNEDDGADAVTATPDFEGTLIGFRAGEDDEYTFHFEFDGMEDALYLLDVETQLYSRVLTGNTYRFTCADKGEYNRFILTRKAPSIGTGVDTGSDGVNSEKAVKFLNRDKMFIFIRGVLYDSTGKRVAERRAE